MSALAIDCESTGLFIHKGCRAYSLGATATDGHIFYWQFPVNPFTRQVEYNHRTLQEILHTIYSYDTLIFHNANFDHQCLAEMHPRLHWRVLWDKFTIHDTMLMSHAYNSLNKQNLKDLATLFLRIPQTDKDELQEAVEKARHLAQQQGWCIANEIHPQLTGTKSLPDCDYWLPYTYAKHEHYPKHHPWYTISKNYNIQDTERTAGLYLLFNDIFEKYHHTAYNRNKLLIPEILDIEYRGVTYSTQAHRTALTTFKARKAVSEKNIHTYCSKLTGNPEFNPNSPAQLSNVLFNILEFTPVKLNKTGPSTDINTLKTLLTQTRRGKKRTLLEDLISIRKSSTTINYLTNYATHSISLQGSRSYRLLKPNFKLTGTNTGRFSCENPNVQNVGKSDMSESFLDEDESEESFKLRNIFGPQRGHTWYCLDYNQFQLRIFAIVSNSTPLIEAIQAGHDIHTTVAKIIFKVAKPTDIQRRAAKYINFGLLFGAGPNKIDKLAGIPGLYSLFMSNFPNAKKYLNLCSNQARKHGFIKTVDGYPIAVPSDRPYAAACCVIQGTEASIVKQAMLRVNQSLRQNSYPNFNMILQVHDELVFDTTLNKTQAKAPIALAIQAMKDVSEELGIPAKVEVKSTTTNWAEAN